MKLEGGVRQLRDAIAKFLERRSVQIERHFLLMRLAEKERLERRLHRFARVRRAVFIQNA